MSAPRRFAIHNLAVTALLGAPQSALVFAEPPARVADPDQIRNHARRRVAGRARHADVGGARNLRPRS